MGTTERSAAPAASSPSHGSRRGRSPFGPAAPSISLALAYAVLLLLWLVLGEELPGGRWLAVHLFTLGVLTNLVLTFSEHFGRTVTRAPGERAGWWPVVTNLGVVMVLVGLPTGHRWLVAAGATVVTATVFASYLRLRAMRRRAVGARFVWIVRVYERAHGAFVHGAILGALLGTGLLSASWYGAGRTAHLHANVLGWGGLTLLATLVFFGPTMTRTRIEPGADARAARRLRQGASGLSVAVLLLVLSAVPGPVGTMARLGAALGLAVLGVATFEVCAAVGRAAFGAKPTAPRWLVIGVCVWFPAVLLADVVVVATGAWRYLDALGAAALAGILAQAILAALTYLAPMLRGRTTATRELVRSRLDTGATLRAVTFQLGVLLLVVAALTSGRGPLAGLGWGAIAGAVLVSAFAALRPVPSSPQQGAAAP